MSSSTLHAGLSEDLISQSLSSFCDGKSISTFFYVIWGNRELRSSAFDIIRSTLVHRYRSIAANDKFKPKRCEEMRDVLAFIREDIRMATYNDELGRMEINGGSESQSVESSDRNVKTITTLVSEWCGIVDYFGMALDLDEQVIWVGHLETRFGRLDNVCIRSPFWTVTSLQFFHEQLELACESIVPPNPTSNFRHLLRHNYGHLVALGLPGEIESDRGFNTMYRLRDSLSLDQESNRFALVPSHLEYETGIFAFIPTRNDIANNGMLHFERYLNCVWENEDDCDFEEGLSLFGVNAIRIMRRLERAVQDIDAVAAAAGDVGGNVSWHRIIGSDLTSFDEDALL